MIEATELEAKALAMPEEAKRFQITDAASFAETGGRLLNIKRVLGEVDESFGPMTKKAHDAWKEILHQRQRIEAPLLQAESIYKLAMAAYVEMEKAERQREQLRLQKIANEEAERQRIADAMLLHDAGETAMANRKLEERDDVPTVILPPPARIAGISARESWGFDVIDAAKIPLEYLIPNMVKIGAVVRACKGATNIPGIRVRKIAGISARRT